MKKYKRATVCGTKTYVAIEKKPDRPMFPRPCVYKSACKYDRNAQKRMLRREYEF